MAAHASLFRLARSPALIAVLAAVLSVSLGTAAIGHAHEDHGPEEHDDPGAVCFLCSSLAAGAEDALRPVGPAPVLSCAQGSGEPSCPPVAQPLPSAGVLRVRGPPPFPPDPSDT